MKSSTIIFLDIDGVMNSFDDIIEGNFENRPTCIDCPDWIDIPTVDKLILLQTLCNEADAAVVLTSAWGEHPNLVEMLKTLFNAYDIPFEDYFDVATDKRGKQIVDWLSEHPEVDSFVVLDDEEFDFDDWTQLQDKVIIVNYNKGLSAKDCTKALAILE